MTTALTLDAACAMMAIKVEPVTLPGGATLWVRQLDAGDVLAAGNAVNADGDAAADINKVASNAAQYLCDSQGRRLADPYKPDDVAKLAACGWPYLRAIIKAGEAINADAAPKNG